MGHAWCRNIPRDLAVRAAEDGRDGPLQTLERCIETARALMPKSVSASTAPEQENKANGMRTERITLEVTHDLDAPLGGWIVQVIDESLGYDESVRVVEESAPAARGWLTAEEREAVEWFCGSPKAISTEQCDRWKDALRALLARSTPPEVVLPQSWREAAGDVMEADEIRAALAAGGFKVKEVG